MRYLIIELFDRENVPRKITEFSMGRYVGVPSEGHQRGGRKPAKTSGVYLGYFKAFLLSAGLSHIDINASITCQLIRPQKKNNNKNKNTRPTFCHALRQNLKFKLLYLCYPAENKQANGNLYFLLCDEEKRPKLCLVMNFSFL